MSYLKDFFKDFDKSTLPIDEEIKEPEPEKKYTLYEVVSTSGGDYIGYDELVNKVFINEKNAQEYLKTLPKSLLYTNRCFEIEDITLTQSQLTTKELYMVEIPPTTKYGASRNYYFTSENEAYTYCDKLSDVTNFQVYPVPIEDRLEVLLAPSVEHARSLVSKGDVIATVEAEYGDVCIEGNQITLAHHGSRSSNPAPCNADVEPLTCGKIVVSHLDLDTVGGVLALLGRKPEDKEFWKGAEFIDVKGPHHIHELEQKVQDQLNAVYAWSEKQEHGRTTEIVDVTDKVTDWLEVLEPVTDINHPQHNYWIEEGKQWAQNVSKEVESKLVFESDNVRAFITDGVFCSAAYYSPKKQNIAKATVALNTKFKSITIAFEDGGKEFSARQIVQKLWGPEAGGHNGIAGSPRNWDITDEELKKNFEVAVVQTEVLCQHLVVETPCCNVKLIKAHDISDSQDER